MSKFKIGLGKKQETNSYLRDEMGRLLYYQSPFSVKEAYRSARTNVMFLPRKEGNRCQSLVVTSSNAGEGKSTNCANLAIALAQSGKQVLLIDCDMRKPKIHRMMRYHQAPGLSGYLAGMERTLKIHENSHVENLGIITAGTTPPNPTELLSSTAMNHMLQMLSEEYDYILLDTPPINMVSDSLVLAQQVGGYVLVVRSNVTDRNDLDQALQRLKQVDARVMGFFLNDVNPKSGRYGKYGKYGTYERYGDAKYTYEEDKKERVKA